LKNNLRPDSIRFMKHRVFLAINLPQKIKDNLISQQLRWAELPCRWTRTDNLHITLTFLGGLEDDDLINLIKIVQKVAQKHAPFFIKLEKITYGPNERAPRMVWVNGEINQYLNDLENDLDAAFKGLPQDENKKDKRQYTPHITLGRLKTWEFNKIEPEERPQVNEDISLSFEARSIDIMDSNLKKGGPEYTILESIPLE
jgi:RNA 2',3'-cyclic 3'-phosphodiesterase